jgi:hypothetical protein
MLGVQLVFYLAESPLQRRSPVVLLLAGVLLLLFRSIAGPRPLLVSCLGFFAVALAGTAPYWLDGMAGPAPSSYLVIAGICSLQAVAAGWRLNRKRASRPVPRASVVSP